MAELVDSDLLELSFTDHRSIDEVIPLDLGSINHSLYEGNIREEIDEYKDSPFSTQEVTKWTEEKKSFCNRIDLNGATQDFLASIKTFLNATLQRCRQLAGKPPDAMLEPADFEAIFFNMRFYTIVLEYLNNRIPDIELRATAHEIREMRRVWRLQMIYKTTAENVLTDHSWYAPGKEIYITIERHKYLLRKLGNDMPELDVFVVDENDERRAERIWGNFHQLRELPCPEDYHAPHDDDDDSGHVHDDDA
jgi:hypothetical protein